MTPTITQQRECEARQGLIVRRRNHWGARRPYTDENPVTHPADFIFLHISVTNPDAYESEDQHMRAIEGIGISRFPNTGISYNMVVMPSSRIFEGQPVGRRGAHTVNNFNRRTCSTNGCPSKGTSLGSTNNLNYNARAICLGQNVGDPVTSAQIHSIAKISAAWKRCGYVRRTARLHGHRCVSAKSCPGDKAWAQMGTINKLIEHYTVNGLIPEEDEVDYATFKKFFGDAVQAFALAFDAYQRAVNTAVVNGTAVPAITRDAQIGRYLAVLPFWQTIGRHDVAGKKLAPNFHTVVSRIDWEARNWGAAGDEHSLLDLLKAADDSPEIKDQIIAALKDAVVQVDINVDTQQEDALVSLPDEIVEAELVEDDA